MSEKVAEEAKVARAASFDDEKSVARVSETDSIIEGSEGVTQHEFDTLRKVSDTMPLAAWLVVIVELAERYVLLSLNLGVPLTSV